MKLFRLVLILLVNMVGVARSEETPSGIGPSIKENALRQLRDEKARLEGELQALGKNDLKQQERLEKLVIMLDRRITEISNPPHVPSTFGARNFSGRVSGKNYSFMIISNELEVCPIWEPGDSDPPLSAMKALELAQKAYSKLDSPVPNDQLKSISLTRLTKGHWCWVVTWEDFYMRGTAQLKVDRLSIPVLMNGSIPEAEVTSIEKRNANKANPLDPPSSAQ